MKTISYIYLYFYIMNRIVVSIHISVNQILSKSLLSAFQTFQNLYFWHFLLVALVSLFPWPFSPINAIHFSSSLTHSLLLFCLFLHKNSITVSSLVKITIPFSFSLFSISLTFMDFHMPDALLILSQAKCVVIAQKLTQACKFWSTL